MTKKKNTKTTEIAVKEENPVAVKTPQGYDYDTNIGVEDMILPRIELLQALSPAVVEEGKRAGTIVNSLDKTDLGMPVSVVPIYVTKHWIRWRERGEGGGIMWRSNDPKDERVIAESNWGVDGSKPLATAYLNFLCLVDGQDMPLILSFCNTNYKVGKKMLTLTRTVPGHIYNCVYELISVHRQNNKGQFFVFDVKKKGPSTSEQRDKAAQMQALFSGKDLNFDSEKQEVVEEDEF